MGLDIEAINVEAGMVLLSDGVMIPVLGHYDHSGSLKEVSKSEATQLVAGSDELGYWCIQLKDFNCVTIN